MSSERATQLVDAGIWLKLSGDVDGARRLFERALKLDPEHARAKELLAQSATTSVAPPMSSSPSNPFERVSSSPSAAEMDWGAATGFEGQDEAPAVPPGLTPAAEAPPPEAAPAPERALPRSSESAITDDWGRATGQTPSPVPQVAPVLARPHSTSLFGEERSAPPVPGRRETLPFADGGSRPAGGAASSPQGPPRETLQFASSDSQQGAREPSAPFASTGSQPGVRRETLPFASAQAGLEAPAQNPFASSGSQPGVRRETLPFASAQAGREAPAQNPFASSDSRPGTGPAAPPGLHRTTLPFASSGSPAPQTSSTPARQTMMFSTQPSSTPGLAQAPRFAPPAAPVGPPNLAGPSGPPAEAPARSGKRDTLTFSANDFQPLGPSTIPEVVPVVIRLGAEEPVDGADSEAPSLEDSLRNQVNATRAAPPPPSPPPAPRAPAPTAPPVATKPPPVSFSPPNPPHAEMSLDAPDPMGVGNVVITDRAPEPSPPRATPPMFSDDAPQPLDPGTKGSAGPAQVDDAWNWSASSPAPAPGLVGEPSPRPSPQLTPEASSAWDQRSNPGISLADVSAPRAPLEFVSSSSKVTRATDTRKDEIAVLVRGAKDLIELDDHTGAMELIAKALALSPDDPDVKQLQERSERTLLAMFESKLGHLDKLPRVLLKDDEIIWLNLDHRAGFVLAQIDGAMTFDDLFAVSGMSRIDTARILAQLVDEGVISRG